VLGAPSKCVRRRAIPSDLNHSFSISPTLYQACGKRGAGRE
jgi:hypothetical protein